VRRLVPVAVALALVAAAAVAGPASAKTRDYGTGAIGRAIPAAGSVEQGVRVGDRGPVSYVAVALRISAPAAGDLTVSLVSPAGTIVPLAVRRGGGADFGTGRGCSGQLTVFDSDQGRRENPVSAGRSPFVESPYRADGNLARLYGEQARGRWRLRIENAGSARASLGCFRLTLSVATPETLTAAGAGVSASVSFIERDYRYSRIRIGVARRGTRVVDASLAQLGCRGCADWRPTDATVRDLDGGEPEVVIEFFTGGAHCCSETVVLRWDGSAYQPKILDWGNFGYRIVDLDGDGAPEIVAYDERFLYLYAAYAFSAAPPRIWHYDQGKLVDVTRSHPGAVAGHAADLLQTYERALRERVDTRGIAAAYVAALSLLGRSQEADAWLDAQAARGAFDEREGAIGGPYGAKWVATLHADLLRFGYA